MPRLQFLVTALAVCIAPGTWVIFGLCGGFAAPGLRLAFEKA